MAGRKKSGGVFSLIFPLDLNFGLFEQLVYTVLPRNRTFLDVRFQYS